ncbi:hypothetical protein BQ8420_28260 [Nocardiopsis sp. JB363]|nr:hypothetical protein BQ8420_28260 [Nocardiopsis sp. JB363]
MGHSHVCSTLTQAGEGFFVSASHGIAAPDTLGPMRTDSINGQWWRRG